MPFASLFAEPEEPDYDYEPLGGTVVARLQVALGAQRVRRSTNAPRALGSHLEAGHRALQQVSLFISSYRESDAPP